MFRIAIIEFTLSDRILMSPTLLFTHVILALSIATSGRASASQFTERVTYADSLELQPEVLR